MSKRENDLLKILSKNRRKKMSKIKEHYLQRNKRLLEYLSNYELKLVFYSEKIKYFK